MIRQMLILRDLTGEGESAQFVLFLYDACGIVSTSVYGYNRRSDRAAPYQVEIVQEGQEPEMQIWVEQIFARTPIRPGQWVFTWEIHHGSDDVYHENVAFDPIRQVFVVSDHQKTKFSELQTPLPISSAPKAPVICPIISTRPFPRPVGTECWPRPAIGT